MQERRIPIAMGGWVPPLQDRSVPAPPNRLRAAQPVVTGPTERVLAIARFLVAARKVQ